MRRAIVAVVLSSLIYINTPRTFAQSPPTRVTDTSALLNEALDKPVNLQINTTLPQAMTGIADKTGVRIVADRSVWELLPWGEQTNVTATLENQSLRTALDAIARKLGLEVVLRQENVELRPTPALTRLGRRATVEELAALDLLASNRLGLDTDRPTVRQLVDAVDQKLQELKTPYNVEFRPAGVSSEPPVNPDAPLSIARNATLAEALEAMSRDTSATWYPWGKAVVVLHKEAQVRSQLEKRVNLRYSGVDLGQVLTELCQASKVNLSIEPGALMRVPPEVRTVSLDLQMTVREALERISGFTGLGYVVNSKGVYIWNQSSAPAATQTQERAIGMIQVDGMTLLIRPSEIEPELREYLEHKLKQELDKLRQKMKDEGFKPSEKEPEPKDL